MRIAIQTNYVQVFILRFNQNRLRLCGGPMQTLSNGYVIRKSDGAVVTHPALVAMPYEESIESWIREYFPTAAYARRVLSRVCAADIAVAEAGVCVLQAPKGTGKSKAICAAVATLPASTSVLQITFRRSLAWSSCFMLGADATLYSNITDAVISARSHPRLTIVINSVARVRGCYDVVVIDEIVSVLDMLSGSLLDAPTRVATCTVLANLIGSAKTVIIADAMLDAACIDFVLLCRQMARAERGERLHPLPALRVVDYVQRIHADYTYVPHASLDTWMAGVIAAIEARKRLVIPCMTKAQALRVRDACVKHLPASEVFTYTADTDPAVLRAHMSDIHAHWRGARVLIYSPVITAGCSFELPHFDVVFFYGYVGTGAVRSAIQMIARVRDVSTKTVHVYIGGNDTSFAAMDVGAISGPPAFARVLSYKSAFMALLNLLDVHRALESRCALEAFAYYFWSLVVHSGAKIGFPAAARKGAEDAAKPNVTDAATLCASAQLIHEPWWAHDWHAPALALDYEPGCAVSASGALLQRASKLHPNHIMDSAAALTYVRLSATPSRLPEWVTRELAPRYRCWAQLIAAKAFVGTDVAHINVTRTRIARRQFADGDDAAVTPHVLFFAPPCARVRHASETCSKAYTRAVDAYLDPSNSWMDVTQHAWVLAAMDVALQRNTQPSNDVLFESPMPTSALPEALHIITQVQACVTSLVSGSAYVDVHAAWGTPPAGSELSFSKRACTGVGLVHFILTEVAPRRVHLVCCRGDGSADVNGLSDVAKMRVLMAAEDTPVASITMLYVTHGSYARCSAFTDATTPILSIARSSPAYVPAWKPLDKRGFIWVPSETEDVFYVYCNGSLHTCCDSAQLAARIAAADCDAWIGWGLRQWACHTRAALQAGFVLTDIEATIHASLRLMDDGILNIHQASVVSVGAPGLAHDTHPSYDAMQALLRLFIGLCVKRYVVYFWNGKPHAVHVPSFRFEPFCVSNTECMDEPM